SVGVRSRRKARRPGTSAATRASRISCSSAFSRSGAAEGGVMGGGVGGESRCPAATAQAAGGRNKSGRRDLDMRGSPGAHGVFPVTPEYSFARKTPNHFALRERPSYKRMQVRSGIFPARQSESEILSSIQRARALYRVTAGTVLVWDRTTS